VFLRTGILFLLALAWGCATTHVYDYASEPDPRKSEFTLGVSDVLRINVWRNPELSVEVVVRPDGTISLPLVGDLRAAGRTPAELRGEISQKLKTFIKEDADHVTVAVSAVNSYRFVVSGNVERPGAYTANHFVTVTEALALAGGPNRYAAAADTVIIRADAKGQRRIPVDYPGILTGKASRENLPVISGDTIYVP
jgi:polysaccharide export outer membrane protein